MNAARLVRRCATILLSMLLVCLTGFEVSNAQDFICGGDLRGKAGETITAEFFYTYPPAEPDEGEEPPPDPTIEGISMSLAYGEGLDCTGAFSIDGTITEDVEPDFVSVTCADGKVVVGLLLEVTPPAGGTLPITDAPTKVVSIDFQIAEGTSCGHNLPITFATQKFGNADAANIFSVDGESVAPDELVSCEVEVIEGERFIRGDCNFDSNVDLTDAASVVTYIFGSGTVGCEDACDANDDGSIDITDPINLLNLLFAMGAPLPPPYPGSGEDLTEDGLDCDEGGFCSEEAQLLSVQAPMLRGDTDSTSQGWAVRPLVTVGEVTADGGDFNDERYGYRIPGIFDGIGAYDLDENVVRILVNHEFGSGAGYAYQLASGAELRGARVSFVDIDRQTRRVLGMDMAYDTVYDAAGNEVVDGAQIRGGGGFNRFCSSYGGHAGQFGLEDDVYFTGEETGGGQEAAVDVAGEAIYVLPALGRAAWENATTVENFGSDKTLILVGDDRGRAPLLLYVGQKGGAYTEGDYTNPPDFLARNGLAQGNLYVWVAEDGRTDFSEFTGTGNTIDGTFVKIDHYDPSPAEVPFVKNFLVLGPIANEGGATPGDEFLQGVQIQSQSDASIDESDPGYLPAAGDTVPDNILTIVTPEECENCEAINPGGVLSWNRVDGESLVDFNEYYGASTDNTLTAIAFYVCLSSDQDVSFGVGSDDSFSLRVDGAVVGFRDVARGTGAGQVQDVVGPVALTAGKHLVIYKVYNGGGGHAGGISVFGDDFAPIEGLSISVDPNTDDCDISDFDVSRLFHDSEGFAEQDYQDFLATEAGAMKFSRPEDVARNPADGTQIVLASTGRGFSDTDADLWGTTYIIDLDDDALLSQLPGDLDSIDNLPASLRIIYDGDDAGGGQFAHPDMGIRSPDNLDWADDGLIYVQEDRSVGGFCLTSGREASVWLLDPATSVATRLLEMSRTAVPSGTSDGDPNDCGDWESSGILDVTSYFPTAEGEKLFILDVQAHSVRSGAIGGGGDLVQGGQLLLMSNAE